MAPLPQKTREGRRRQISSTLRSVSGGCTSFQGVQSRTTEAGAPELPEPPRHLMLDARLLGLLRVLGLLGSLAALLAVGAEAALA